MKRRTWCRGSGQAVHEISRNSWNACPNRDERCIRTFSLGQLIRRGGQYLAPAHKLVRQENSSPARRKRTRAANRGREHRGRSSRR